MNRWPWRRQPPLGHKPTPGALVLLAMMAAVVTLPATAAVPGDAQRGRLLYDTGADASGRPLRATRPGFGPLRPEAVACASCHRPSTMGGTEGGLLVPPVRGDILFAPGQPPSTRLNMRWMRHQTRSAYDDASFSRALRQGIDPDGHALGPQMPRYAMGTRDQADLAAYLRQRGQEPVPGLADGVLTVATVFTPDAPKARRDTVMAAMSAWAQGQRFGPVRVQWQPWVLQGEPASWGAQLATLNQRTPVFGLVSGAGGAHWSPVQAFCEQQRLACVFPSVDRVPAWTTPPRHTVYLSAGVDGEARMLAHALAAARKPPAEVVQVWQGDAGDGAAKTLGDALRNAFPAAAPPVRQVAWSGPGTAAALKPGSVLVLWLDAEAATAWLRAHAPGPEQGVVLSAQLAPAQSVQVPAAWQAKLRWVSMRATPVDFRGALASALEPWAQAVAASGRVSAVELGDARAAAFLFSDAAGLTQGQLRPDYLIERLETSVQQRTAASVYLRASLGPHQRVASKGGHLLGYRPGGPPSPVAVSAYLRAEP